MPTIQPDASHVNQEPIAQAAQLPVQLPTMLEALTDDAACDAMQVEATRLRDAAVLKWKLGNAHREWLLTERDTIN